MLSWGRGERRERVGVGVGGRGGGGYQVALLVVKRFNYGYAQLWIRG